MKKLKNIIIKYGSTLATCAFAINVLPLTHIADSFFMNLKFRRSLCHTKRISKLPFAGLKRPFTLVLTQNV